MEWCTRPLRGRRRWLERSGSRCCATCKEWSPPSASETHSTQHKCACFSNGIFKFSLPLFLSSFLSSSFPQRVLLKAVSEVTIADLNRVGKEYFCKLFDPKLASCAICCNPSKATDVKMVFEKYVSCLHSHTHTLSYHLSIYLLFFLLHSLTGWVIVLSSLKT